MRDIGLALMTGVDIPIPELQLAIHQPTLKEISQMGEKNFFIGIQFLCLNKRNYVKDESLLDKITNFQIFMRLLDEKSLDLEEDLRSIIMNMFSLLLPDFKVLLTPQSILLQSENQENLIIDESNFDILQTYLKEVLCTNMLIGSGQGEYNPKGAKAKAIADKIMEGRRKVAELNKGQKFESPFVKYISVLTLGIPSMSLQDCINLTMFQIYDLMERYGLYVAWDLDIKSRLAGGKPDSKPDDWTKNIH